MPNIGKTSLANGTRSIARAHQHWQTSLASGTHRTTHITLVPHDHINTLTALCFAALVEAGASAPKGAAIGGGQEPRRRQLLDAHLTEPLACGVTDPPTAQAAASNRSHMYTIVKREDLAGTCQNSSRDLSIIVVTSDPFSTARNRSVVTLAIAERRRGCGAQRHDRNRGASSRCHSCSVVTLAIAERCNVNSRGCSAAEPPDTNATILV